MSNKSTFKNLTTSTVTTEGAMTLIVEGVSLPEKLADVVSLPASQKGTPILGIIEGNFPVTLADGTITEVWISGSVGLPRKLAETVRNEAAREAKKAEKAAQEALKAIDTLKALGLTPEQLAALMGKA